jgi:hypothetical protein
LGLSRVSPILRVLPLANLAVYRGTELSIRGF